MTPEERQQPRILNGRRKKRIARGSGRSAQEINQLLTSFEQMRKMMKQLGGPKGMKALRGMGDLDLDALAAGGGLPGGLGGLPGGMGGLPGGLGGSTPGGPLPPGAKPRGKSVPKRKRKGGKNKKRKRR